MDSYEATRIVFSKIQNLDPENASKIMGYLLLQDHGDKEMIRLAFGPEAHIQSLILKAKTHLGLHNISNPPTPNTPSPSPFSLKPSPLSSSNGFENTSLSYASIVNGSGTNGSKTNNESVDDYQFHDHLSFLHDSKHDDLLDLAAMSGGSNNGYSDSLLHRRSFSVPGLCLGAEVLNSPLGFKPCLYFARGFCKNGTSCRFIHGGDHCGESATKMNELLRSKSLQQQKQAAAAAASQFIAGGGGAFPYNKCVNFLLQQQQIETQRSAAAALMMGDEVHKYGRCRPERNDFSSMGANPGSRQIYLTFPADSTFKEEDVSGYFSIYGPVQDVRIPYQQKRMFGFVTYVYPETVKLILAKGNPHFVCNSRVLVKPYKEKAKVQEKKQQQLDRGEYSACSSPTPLDSHSPREPFDLHLGTRMFYNTQEMLLRRKLEEQAIELQGRRLMNLQLLDFKNHHGLSTGSPIPSPTVSRTPTNQASIFSADGIDLEIPEENGGSLVAAVDADKLLEEVNRSSNRKNDNNNGVTNDEKANTEECDFPESLDHILPDYLFASPKKSTGDHLTVADDKTVNSNSNPSQANASGLNMASLKSCFLQLPRFSSGQGAIGM